MIYDVIVVGAGPGGSSAATFLARQGFSVLLLDKADFPRDKVCGDGLTPQAICWLDVLGCVEEVLSQTNSCITSADVYVNGEHVLAGSFPQDTAYPGFCTLLERRKLDDLLARNAVARGAVFKPRHRVRELFWREDRIVVEAASGCGSVRFGGKLLIGADGASSIVSRSIGNVPRHGTTAVCLRTYFQGVKVDGSQLKVYFDERFFPGYGWVFVDDGGKANVGLGYATDQNFAAKPDLRRRLQAFVQSDLSAMLQDATPLGKPAGWWSCFSRPKAVVADRVMLVGDAANLADPMNGGGIHKAMESAYLASLVSAQALAWGDCSQQVLALYDRLWNQRNGLDWRTGEFLVSIAKNPNLRELYLSFLKAVGKLGEDDQRFRDFCTGVFTEVTARSACLSPLVLFDVVPLAPSAWTSLFRSPDGTGVRGTVHLATSALRESLQMTGRVVSSPTANLRWGLEVVAKMLGLVECYAERTLGSMPT